MHFKCVARVWIRKKEIHMRLYNFGEICKPNIGFIQHRLFEEPFVTRYYLLPGSFFSVQPRRQLHLRSKVIAYLRCGSGMR